MTNERLRDLLDLFPARRIAVVGDFFIDKYLDTDPLIAELSVETGKTAHQVVTVRHSPGAAGTVVRNLAALGTGALYALGIVGDDGEAYDLLNDLHELGCRTEGLIRSRERMTPTYLKPRDMNDPGLTGEHERYDTKNRTATPPALLDRVIRALDDLLPELHGVIVSDQVVMDDCGVITTEMRAVIADRALRYPNVVFMGDSRAHIREFRNIVVKPNEFEAVGWYNPLPGDTVNDDMLREAIMELRRMTNAPVCATRGARGMFVSDPEPTAVRGVRVEGPLDITGAGDSALAGTALALASGASLPEAALIGNLVASITIQQLATTGTASRAEVMERFGLWLAQEKETFHE